ncbi:MAG: hypothetical protein GF332_03325 [Candidatus Moranbacteria bacterium]|nr:hypothetical protein [Candidatus Moranbacteria bacterium]
MKNQNRLKIFSLISLFLFSGCFNSNLAELKPDQDSVTSQPSQTKHTQNNPGSAQTGPSKPPNLPDSQLYPVIKVTDGDTIWVKINARQEKIRMIGLDTPETVDPRKPVQCFGQQASNQAKKLLKNQKVRLEADPTQGERDKYNRLLRYVYLENGTLYNQYMIEQGYAYEYTYNVPYKYQKQFKQAEQQARQRKRGLWADQACASPSTINKASSGSSSKSQDSSSHFSCDCQLTCRQIKSCAQAKYLLKDCSCLKLDRDQDGIPCENICE